jgi:NADH:ubiquinone oxidoreductase subunit 6 (subunit J)
MAKKQKTMMKDYYLNLVLLVIMMVAAIVGAYYIGLQTGLEANAGWAWSG